MKKVCDINLTHAGYGQLDTKATLGVEPAEEKNKDIYTHYGFTEFINLFIFFYVLFFPNNPNFFVFPTLGNFILPFYVHFLSEGMGISDMNADEQNSLIAVRTESGKVFEIVCREATDRDFPDGIRFCKNSP